jgi:hypothetical protein
MVLESHGEIAEIDRRQVEHRHLLHRLECWDRVIQD